MKKIDNAIEKEMMESGAMGTESVTVNIYLTDDEKEEFMDSQNHVFPVISLEHIPQDHHNTL